MRPCLLEFAFLWIAIGAGIAAGPISLATANEFFAPAQDTAMGLVSNGIYPNGQTMGFGLYSISGLNDFDPTRTNMRRAGDAGFTLAGPYYHSNWQNFQFIYAAAAEGLSYTYQIREHPLLEDVEVNDRPSVISGLIDAQIAGHVEAQVEAILADSIAVDTVARWSLAPEELRFWTADEMRYLQVVSDTVRQVEIEQDVSHRPLWMYEPNHRESAHLVTSGAAQDLVSKGMYVTTRHDRGDQRSGWIMWSFDQITSAADILGTVPQAVFQLSEDFTDALTGSDPAQIRRVIRHDVYLGLVQGIKSINVFSMWENRPNLTTHNDQFEAYGSVASDLTGELNLQHVFLFGEVRDDLAVSVLAGQQAINYTHTDGKPFSFESVNYLNTAVGNDRYLILVNSSETTIELEVDGLPTQYLVADLFGGTSEAVSAPTMSVTMNALDVLALRISRVDR